MRRRTSAGFAVMQFLARECGYTEPQPIEPQDERAELERAFVASVRALRQIEQRMERLAQMTQASTPSLRPVA